MKSESILNAFGKISDELIADADITQRSKKGNFPWKAFLATAACLCLIFTAAFAIPHLFPNTTIGPAPEATKSPAVMESVPVVTKPPATTASAPMATKPPATTASAPVATKPPATTASVPVATKPPATIATVPVVTKPPATTASVPVATKPPVTIATVPVVTKPPATEPPGIVNPPGDNKLNYGQVLYLSVDNKTDTGISALAFQHIVGTANPKNKTTSSTPPKFGFRISQINVIAKAIKELGLYETFNEYGSTRTKQYRLFLMEVIDPLQSGLDGTFHYLLPANLKGDLTQYGALLIAMSQRPKNFVLQNGENLTAFDYLFGDPYDQPELGNMIAFTDGIFDESLWQDRSWRFGYQFGKHYLDENDDSLLVSRGSTLEEALQRRQDRLKKTAQVKHIEFQTEAAQQLMDYLKPYENGVFIPEQMSSYYRVRRYINGSPTNEWYQIDYETEEVKASEYRFEDEDFENLPDISSYIAGLDLEKIAPQHTDPSGKTMVYNTAVGWYEKTENGVYSVVRIAWRYFDQDDSFVEYYDETFILLDETGDHIISREELIELIGENQNIYNKEYGVATSRPMY